MEEALKIHQLKLEAIVFAKYFSKQNPGQEIIDKYLSGCRILIPNESDAEKILIQKLIRNPWMIPFADAAHSFPKKNSLLRKKLLLMFSILETSVDYYSDFTSEERSRFYWFLILYKVMKAIFKLIVGKILMIFL